MPIVFSDKEGLCAAFRKGFVRQTCVKRAAMEQVSQDQLTKEGGADLPSAAMYDEKDKQ